MQRYDVLVVGGGIVGLATAWALAGDAPGTRVAVLEKEQQVAAHQTGRNSGVVHSGVYYRPGSVKARMVAAGRRPLLDLCAAHGVPVRLTGKVIVATEPAELARLSDLHDRGVAHGLRVRRLDPAALREVEPHVRGLAALHVPEAGVTDFAAVARALAADVVARGGVVATGCEVRRLEERGTEVVAETSTGAVAARAAVVCAGLRSGALAGGGGSRDVLVVPFRGDYRTLAPAAAGLVRSLVYPVADPRFPFLGVHLTRGVDGDVHAGPSAVLALHREGYRRRDVDAATVRELAGFPGTWRMAARYWRTGLAEVHRSLSPTAFLRAVRRLLPAVEPDHLLAAPSGVRAQAVARDGTLLDDFAFRETARVVHVVNAPSPAATASLAIGRQVALATRQRLGSR